MVCTLMKCLNWPMILLAALALVYIALNTLLGYVADGVYIQ